MEPNNTSFQALPASLPQSTIAPAPEPLLRLPDLDKLQLSELSVPPNNARGVQSFSDFVNAVRNDKSDANDVQPPVVDRHQPFLVCGKAFRFEGVPVAESEISYQSDSTESSASFVQEVDKSQTSRPAEQTENGHQTLTSAQAEESLHVDEAQQQPTPAQSWAPVSPQKGILRHPSEAPSPSPKRLVYDYASTASPASRRVSTVSFLPSPRRASMHRRLSHDASVQVELPVDDIQTNETQAAASAKKIRRRRSSMQSRRTSFTSIRGPTTYAGFQPVGFTDAGAMLCELNGVQFELVVDDIDPEEHVGTQCQPLDIEVEMDLLFENMDKYEDDGSESVMEVEQMRSEALPPPSHVGARVSLGNKSNHATGAESLSMSLAPLPDLPVTPGASAVASVQANKSVQGPVNMDSSVVYSPARQGARCRRSEARNVVAPSPVPNSVSAPVTGNRTSTSTRGPRSGISGARTSSRGYHTASHEHHETPSSRKNAPRTVEVPVNASPQHEVLSVPQEEELVEAAVVSGVDPDDDEEIIATTAHAAMPRPSYPPFALVDQVLGSLSKDLEPPENLDRLMEKTPKSCNTRRQDSSVQIVEETDRSLPQGRVQDPSNLSLSAGAPGTADRTDRRDAHGAREEEPQPRAPQREEIIDADAVPDVQEGVENQNHVQNEGPIPAGPVNPTSSHVTPRKALPNPMTSLAPTSTTAPPVSKSKELTIQHLAPVSAPEYVASERKTTDGASRTANASDRKAKELKLHLNMFHVEITPKVTAYQLAVLNTITPNTKAKLDNLRESNTIIHPATSGVPMKNVVRNLDAGRASSYSGRSRSKHERGTCADDAPCEENCSKLKTQRPDESSAGSVKKRRGMKSDLPGSQGDLRPAELDRTQPCTRVGRSCGSSGLQHQETDGRNARGESLVMESEPQQPEVLRRMSGAAPTTLFANVQPEVEVIDLDGSDDDKAGAQDNLLADTAFSGLVSPAPLSRGITPRQSIVGTAEVQDTNEDAPTVRNSRTTSKETSANTRRTSSRSETRKSKEHPSNRIISLSERIEMQTRNSACDRDSSKTANADDLQAQQDAVHETHLDEDAFCDQNDFDEACAADDVDYDELDGDFNMEATERQTPIKEERKPSRSLSVSTGKKSGSNDSCSAETTDAPMLHSDSKEDESPIRKQLSLTPTTSEADVEVSPSPVMRKKLRKASKKKGVKKPKKCTVSRKGKKRQWRELAHLPTQEVRIDDGPGPRRSKRQRFPRLKYWKNEVVAYERRVSQVMPTVSQVLVDVGDTDSEESWMPRV